MRGAADRILWHVASGARVAVVVSTPMHRGNRMMNWMHRLNPSPSAMVARELDRAAAADEDLTASILAAVVASLGIAAASLTAGEVSLRSEGEFGAGVLTDLDVRPVEALLDPKIVAVLGGGHAYRSDGEVVMLAPRGADLTAVLLTDRLGGRDCHLVTDREGMDPASHHGPPVHPEAKRLAEERGIILQAYSFRTPLATT